MMASQEGPCGWVQRVVDVFLQGRMVLLALKEFMVDCLLRRPLLDLVVLDNFHPVLKLSFGDKIQVWIIAMGEQILPLGCRICFIFLGGGEVTWL